MTAALILTAYLLIGVCAVGLLLVMVWGSES
jgi:hypothetical protein